MTQINDGLTNLLTGLGNPMRDKLAGIKRVSNSKLSKSDIDTLYRDSWVAGKFVDLPAHDATREWREWIADGADVSKIEALENRLELSRKVGDAYKLARKYGRGFLYFDTGDDPELPVDPIKVTDINFVTVLSNFDVLDGDLQDDPMLAGYGEPAWYEFHTKSNGFVRIHPSRLVIFYGDKQTSSPLDGIKANSVLQRAYEVITQHDSVMHYVASMVPEAIVDIWLIPDLAQTLSDPDSEAAFIKAQGLSNMLKGVHGTVFQDAGTDSKQTKYERKHTSFATLPDVIEKFRDAVCAAVGFSKEYFYVGSGVGLGNNGQATLEMDYGKIGTIQSSVFEPAMALFDECLINAALGGRSGDIHFNWRSLWSMSDDERAKIGKTIAETFKIAVDAQLLPVDVATDAFVDAMTEKGGIALEGHYNEWVANGGGGSVDDIGMGVTESDFADAMPHDDTVAFLSNYLGVKNG